MNETIQNQNEEEINQDQNQNQINELLVELSNSSSDDNDEVIRHILRLLSNNSITFRNTIFNRIRENSPLSINEIRGMYEEEHLPPEAESNTTGGSTGMAQWLNRLRARNPDRMYLIYDYTMIEITSNKIYLLVQNKDDYNNPIKETIADFSLKLLFKTIDYKKNNMTYYTFLANNNLFYNYSVIDFLDLYTDKVYKSSVGKDVVKFVFNNKSRNIPEKKAVYTCGFKNKWYLTFIEGDFSIMWDTDEQRQVINSCKNIYKEYKQEEKEKIKNMYKELIEISEMPKEFITIIVSWCMIAPFKLYFIKHFGLFIHLILSGKLTAGKTTFLDVFTTYFFRLYKEHCAGQTVKSVARFEDIATASTFPRMIDQFEGYSKAVVDVLKEMATSKADYKRKTGAKHQISKPKVASICGTSNTLGNHFKDPSDSSRAIILDYEQSITENLKWAEISDKLRKEKPFSLFYDYTKDWTNKDITKMLKKAIKMTQINETIKEIEKADNGITNIDINYPRIRKAYKIIVAGAYLFRKVFGIRLPLENVFETMLQSRRNISGEFLSEFLAFCRAAKNYDPDAYKNPNFLTCVLYWNMKKDVFYFTQANLKDYKDFTRTKIGIKPLCEKLIEALTDKTLIRYVNRRIGGRQEGIIEIKDDLIIN